MEVSESTFSTLRTKGQKEKGKKAAASGWDISAAEQAPVLMDEAPASEDASPASVHVIHNLSWKWPGYGACNFVATSGVAAEPHNAVEEAIPAEASPTEEPYTIAPEEDPLPEGTLPAEEAFDKLDSMSDIWIAGVIMAQWRRTSTYGSQLRLHGLKGPMVFWERKL